MDLQLLNPHLFISERNTRSMNQRCQLLALLRGRGVSPRGGRECHFLLTKTRPYTDTLINKNEALPTAPCLQLSIITRDIFLADE